MELYRALKDEEKNILKIYTKAFEGVTISEPVLLGSNTYREVVFTKKLFPKFREHGKCYLYLDSSNNIVTNENTLLRLGKLFFFMDAFLSNDKGSIVSAFLKDGDKRKNENDLKSMLEGLEHIRKKGKKYDITSNDVDHVKSILIKLSELREVTNGKLEVFLKTVEEVKGKHQYFNESFIEECMPIYKEMMICNYNKVQLINRGLRHYNSFKKAAAGIRRGYALVFITKHNEPLMKVNYMMSYFENLLKAYGSIATMSQNEYIKNIANAGKTNAEYKMLALRK